MKRPCLLSLAALCVGAAVSSAQMTIPFEATFTFGSDGNVPEFVYNGTDYSADGLAVGSLYKVGAKSSASSNNFRANAWPDGATSGSETLSGSRDSGSYFEVTLTALPGFTMTLESLDFGIGRSGTGPRQSGWSSSLDFDTLLSVTTVNSGLSHTAGVLTNPDTNSSWIGNSIALHATDFGDLSGDLTFRFFMWNAEGSVGTGGLQGPLTISGSVSAVPEPSTYGLLFSLGTLGFVIYRRRSRAAGEVATDAVAA